MTYPRLIPSETPKAGLADYTAIANAVRALLNVQMFTVTIAENTSSSTLTHSIGSVPTAVVLAPVDDVGRCWYDQASLTDTAVDIYVANPPIGGAYTIKVLLYY